MEWGFRSGGGGAGGGSQELQSVGHIWGCNGQLDPTKGRVYQTGLLTAT